LCSFGKLRFCVDGDRSSHVGKVAEIGPYSESEQGRFNNNSEPELYLEETIEDALDKIDDHENLSVFYISAEIHKNAR
jgi:hypothetical protein